MRNLVVSIVLTLISSFAFAQSKSQKSLWNLTVVDSATNKGIERATVLIGCHSFATDINGKIFIDKKLMSEDRVIKLSSIGYKPLSVDVGASRRFPDSIRLSASTTQLTEVKINSSKSYILLGNIKPTYRGSYEPCTNEELANYIPNEKRISGIITSVEVVINNRLKGIDAPFMVQLYSKSDSSAYPDTELIKDSVIVYNRLKKTKLTIDISKYNIQVPENGFFIVFETLSPSWYSKKLINYDGQLLTRLPGMERDFTDDTLIDKDESDRKGKKYSLLRINKAQWRPWTLLAKGEFFAMGVTISSN